MKMLVKNVCMASLLVIALVIVGCSDNPTKSEPKDSPPQLTGISTWDSTLSAWSATINASGFDDFAYFSLLNKDSLAQGMAKLASSAEWEIGFKRSEVILNGGLSSMGEDVKGVSLGAVSFSDVTIDDTTDVTWTSDNVFYQIADWFAYNPATHTLDMTQYVYSMLDAGGENYLKFKIDSLAGSGPPPLMGTIYITYFYQSESNNVSLDGELKTATIEIGDTAGYFNFSSGSQVSVANPEQSLDWDISFTNFVVKQNSGPNGSGECGVFLAYTELDDKTDIAAFTAQPAAPLLPDLISSALTDWYDYDPLIHQLASKGEIYLINSDDVIYKLYISSYYANVAGQGTSGYYTIIFVQL